MSILPVFLFTQKTAYEMRISDWSSDVCSSDLHPAVGRQRPPGDLVGDRHDQEHAGPVDRQVAPAALVELDHRSEHRLQEVAAQQQADQQRGREQDRKSVGEGRGGSVSVELGGARIIKKKKDHTMKQTDE